MKINRGNSVKTAMAKRIRKIFWRIGIDHWLGIGLVMLSMLAVGILAWLTPSLRNTQPLHFHHGSLTIDKQPRTMALPLNE